MSGAAGAVGSAIDCATDPVGCVASSAIDASKALGKDVMTAATATAGPQFDQQWFTNLYAYIVPIGMGLTAIALMLGLARAGLSRSGAKLAETMYGTVRAGLGTAIAVALVVVVLGVANALSKDIAGHVPQQFFDAITTSWGKSGFGGFTAAFLALIVAAVMVVVEAFLWVELIVRGAVLYLAVALIPVALGAAAWPPLTKTLHRMLMLVGILLAFPVLALLGLLIGAGVLAGGVSGSAGVPESAGTILEGLRVFAFAAFMPWGLLRLIGVDADQFHQRHERAGSHSPGSLATGGALVTQSVDGVIGRSGGGAEGGESAPPGRGQAAGGHGGGQPDPTPGSAGSSGASRPRPTTGAVAAMAGWLSAATAAGGNVAQHVGARLDGATGRYGSAPSTAPWQALASLVASSRRASNGASTPSRAPSSAANDASVNGASPPAGSPATPTSDASASASPSNRAMPLVELPDSRNPTADAFGRQPNDNPGGPNV